jgi:hypothetical protein
MSVQTVNRKVFSSPEGENPGLPCAAMSEVQICGIPKLIAGEVASTP